MLFSLLASYYKFRVKLRKLSRMLSVPSGQRVLDIGGGDGPFPRADVVCDKYLGDDSERMNPLVSAGSRALVVGDIENLPFSDKSFDFVFCSHVLEHTDDPARAISELTRIARRGYVEVPSEYCEAGSRSFSAHLWTVRRDADGTLVFQEKAGPVVNPVVDRVYHEQLGDHGAKDPSYAAFYWKNHASLFNICVEWTGSIPHRVERLQGSRPKGFLRGTVEDIETIRKALDRAAGAPRSGLRNFLKSRITSFFTDIRVKEKLSEFVCCPVCQGKLSAITADSLRCDGCRTLYPVVHGVPVLLREHGAGGR